MDIRACDDEADIQATWPVMQQLRPHIPDEAAYLQQVHDLQARHGYRLVARFDGGRVVAAAGYRTNATLYRGTYLYIDDLVTDKAERSKGHGEALMDWLVAAARDAGHGELVLDCGLWREDAHRFYERFGMEKVAYNFARRTARD